LPAKAIHLDTMCLVPSACVAIIQNLHDSMKEIKSPTFVDKLTLLSSLASLYGSAVLPLCVSLSVMIVVDDLKVLFGIICKVTGAVYGEVWYCLLRVQRLKEVL
jgi:hypothetical protein